MTIIPTELIEEIEAKVEEQVMKEQSEMRLN